MLTGGFGLRAPQHRSAVSRIRITYLYYKKGILLDSFFVLHLSNKKQKSGKGILSRYQLNRPHIIIPNGCCLLIDSTM